MQGPVKSISRRLLASWARARGVLPHRLNDILFALPTHAVTDTPALAAREGWAWTDLGPNTMVEPEIAGGDPRAIERLRGELVSAGRPQRAFAAVIPRGRVLGIACSALAPTGAVLTDVCPHAGIEARFHRALSSAPAARWPRRLAGRSVLIGAIGHGNFYHWMFDVLPRIGLAGRAGFGSVDRWIVARSKLAVSHELLSRCGVERSRIHEIGRGGHVECDELVVTSAPGAICEPTPASAEFVRSTLGRPRASSADQPGRRIYVARRGRRKVLNEDAIRPVLARAGFEFVAMEGLPLDAQIDAFAGASVIVAPHGAALAHLVHAARGATLVELFPSEYLNASFYALAGACGVRYAALLGQPDPGGRGAPSMRDYTVGPEELARLLDQLGIR